MNSPASSEKQADQSWAWDHNHHHHHHHNSSNNNLRNSERSVGVPMSVGLERRQFGYDWGPTSTAVVLSGAGDDVDDRKPQIMSGPLMDSINQYHGHGNVNVVALNGMLSSGISHNNIMAAAAVGGNNPLANLISSGARNYGDHHVLGGIRSSSCSSSVGFPGGNGPILSGFGYCGDSREAAALEEQRHHILGMIGMDQKSIFHNMVKQEDFCAGDFPTRIGLNLGGRTYFSTEDNIINRLYKRPRAISPGSQVPRCQAEGCKADLSNAKHYHRRHKVCELHSKASTVISGGINQRFCQQCSRFHVLSEFDEGKRSCRKRLADHNRRRRKPQTNNASAANHNAEAPAAPKAVEDQDTNSGSNHSDVQPETIPRSEAQALLTGISLSPSLPLGLQNSNGQQHNQQYLQQTSPNLSRREMGMEYSRHTTEQKYTSALEIAIPWLKPADSSSEFGGSEKNSSTVQQVSESGASSSNTVQVFSSIQNLLPSVEIGSSDWMVNGGFSGSRNQHFGSADLNLQTSLDGQKVLSLLEKNGGEAAGRGQNKTQNAVEYLPQGGFHSKNGVVDGHSELSTGFSGMQSFRSLGQSMYQNIL